MQDHRVHVQRCNAAETRAHQRAARRAGPAERDVVHRAFMHPRTDVRRRWVCSSPTDQLERAHAIDASTTLELLPLHAGYEEWIMFNSSTASSVGVLGRRTCRPHVDGTGAPAHADGDNGPLRVLILTPFYPPVVSGAGRYVADAAAALAAAGHDVEVLNASGAEGTPIPGVTVRTVLGRLRGSTSLALLWRGVAAHRRQPVDVVVCGVAYPMGVVATMIGRVIRRPVVVMSMGEDVAVGDASRAARAGLKWIFAAAARIIVVSAYTKATAVRLGARSGRCRLIPPGIDPTALSQADETDGRAFRQKYGLDGRRLVLTVARLEARKGHDTVLDAVARVAAEFDDVHYLVVGSGDPSSLRRRARDEHAADRLTVVDHLDADELVQAYAAADVFAMVSRPGAQTEVDGFGIVYLEAAAAG